MSYMIVYMCDKTIITWFYKKSKIQYTGPSARQTAGTMRKLMRGWLREDICRRALEREIEEVKTARKKLLREASKP